MAAARKLCIGPESRLTPALEENMAKAPLTFPHRRMIPALGLHRESD